MYENYFTHYRIQDIDNPDIPLTDSQRKAVKWLYEKILEHDGLGKHKDKYEYKQFDILYSIGGKHIFVSTTVGGKKDEGTLAHILCRTYRNIRVGPRGGMRLLNAVNKKYSRGRNVVWTATN